jgi:hypothetical protein
MTPMTQEGNGKKRWHGPAQIGAGGTLGAALVIIAQQLISMGQPNTAQAAKYEERLRAVETCGVEVRAEQKTMREILDVKLESISSQLRELNIQVRRHIEPQK